MVKLYCVSYIYKGKRHRVCGFHSKEGARYYMRKNFAPSDKPRVIKWRTGKKYA